MANYTMNTVQLFVMKNIHVFEEVRAFVLLEAFVCLFLLITNFYD